MKATDLDGEVSIRGDSGDTWNPYQDADDGEVGIRKERTEYTNQAGEPLIVAVSTEAMPVTDESTGGFEGRFGDWQPSDVNSGEMANYQPDTRDQLQNNPLGTNGPYDVNGNTVDASDMPGGTWPSGPDLTVNQVIAWAEARGDQAFADKVTYLQNELGL